MSGNQSHNSGLASTGTHNPAAIIRVYIKGRNALCTGDIEAGWKGVNHFRVSVTSKCKSLQIFITCFLPYGEGWSIALFSYGLYSSIGVASRTICDV